MMQLWLIMSINFGLLTVVIFTTTEKIPYDLVALISATNTLSPQSPSSSASSPLAFVPWPKFGRKNVVKIIRNLPILTKSKRKATTKLEKNSTKANRTASKPPTESQSAESFLFLCNGTIRMGRNANENNDGKLNSLPRNNYLQLMPKELVRKKRKTLLASRRRQKRTGFPLPAVPLSSSAPAPEEGAYPIAPAPVAHEFFNGPAQIESQQQAAVAKQAFQQGAESPPAFQPQSPTSNAQSSAQSPTSNAQSSAQSPTSNAQSSAQSPTSNAQSSAQSPTSNAQSSAQSPTSNAQSSAQSSAFPASQLSPPTSAAVQPQPLSAPQPSAPLVQPPHPAEPPFGFMPEEQLPWYQPQEAFQPFFPYQEEVSTTTSTVSSTTDRYELRYPLPECYTDDSNLMCCNSQVENTMKTAFDELTNAEENFNRCNVQQIANKVQLMLEDRFNTTFEVISGIGDYASRSHFFHNFICKIEQDDRFVLAYATPRPEFDTMPIGENCTCAFRNSESVQNGQPRQSNDKSNLLNYVYTFRRRTQRAQKQRNGREKV